MMCPNGHAALQIAERHGVEIDYCPECRGVWLDRGELDKIIERAEAASEPSRPAESRREEHRDDRRDAPRDEHRDDRRDGPRDEHRDGDARPYDSHGRPPHRKSKSSWLGDMFDF